LKRSNTLTQFNGATTITIMTLSITTVSITIDSTMRLSITAYRIMTLNRVTFNVKKDYECRIFGVLLSVVLVSVVAPIVTAYVTQSRKVIKILLS
jgi:hypothetical protein